MASTVLHHLLVLTLVLLPLGARSSDGPLGHYCGPASDKVQKTQFNLTQVLDDTINRATVSGFAVNLDEPYILAQCRGDVGSSECTKCLADAEREILYLCQNKPEGRIWYDYCFLRYDDNTNFIGQMDTSFFLLFANEENATNPEEFANQTSKLMDIVMTEAGLPGSAGLGRAKFDFMPHIFIYGLGQCTEDLDTMPCSQCLKTAASLFSDNCKFRKGCQVLYSTCMARYEVYPFFFPLDSNGTDVLDHSDVKVPLP
ncbi:hypothetical protein J5N97_030183 [Dioscorea zingiberensis]|uniref:Gnk2-homologous domain-containing protein n=1 Tax=Dioscorea zingiberensis TaxID=325984 RepID=A0A9D5H3T7_9LILI|nr:hypothetical protein J5N97_030183 [Dioscorea zingiberensis]